MTTQDNATLTRMAYELYNDHQSDPAWLETSLASIAEDCEVFLVPLGMTLRGRDGYKQFLLVPTQMCLEELGGVMLPGSFWLQDVRSA
jgi:hypothetical protein